MTEAEEGDLIYTKYGFHIFVKFGAKYDQRGISGPRRVYARDISSTGVVSDKVKINPHEYLVIARRGKSKEVWESGLLRVAMDAWRNEE